MKSNRAELPVIFLVVGVFAICGLAILIFLTSSFHVRNSFIGIGSMQELNSLIEESAFKGEDVGRLYREINETRYSFSFDWRKEVLLFSVEFEGDK
jgi:hypothetical protein